MAYAAIAPLLRAGSSAARKSIKPPVAVQPPAAPATAAPVAAPAPDWQADPVLQRIIAQQQASVAQAQAQALANRQRLEIAYGYDPNYHYADESTRAAAQQNPFSTLAGLTRQHGENVHNIDENLNKQNLFYSGFRGKTLGNESTNYLQQNYNANQALQSGLSGVAQNLLAAQTGSAQAIGSAQDDAYTRGLNFQLQYGGNYAAPPAAAAAPSVATSLVPPRPTLPRAGQILRRQGMPYR